MIKCVKLCVQSLKFCKHAQNNSRGVCNLEFLCLSCSATCMTFKLHVQSVCELTSLQTISQAVYIICKLHRALKYIYFHTQRCGRDSLCVCTRPPPNQGLRPLAEAAFREHFYQKEHRNYVAEEPDIGPLVLSIKEEGENVRLVVCVCVWCVCGGGGGVCVCVEGEVWVCVCVLVLRYSRLV